MELRTLRAFVEVVRQGGFSQAAKIIHATQPTISKAVKQLEEEVGVPLLDRIGHRCVMTAAGEIVYRRAQTMLAEREDMVAELGDLSGLKKGTLRLGISRIGANTLFAPIFAAYRTRYPGIDIQVVEHGSERLLEIMLEGGLDLAASLLPTTENFDYQPLRREPMMALLPTTHPLAHAQSLDLAELASSPFILFEAGFTLNQVIADACQRRGFSPTVTARSGQIDFIVELVANGLGVAFLPRLIALHRPHPLVRYVLLADRVIDWHMAMVWRRGGYLSHAAQAWLALAHELTPDRNDAPLA